MASQHRRSAVVDGQLTAEFRSRVQSGFQSNHPELANLVDDVGEPCWLNGPTAAALHPFDGFRLAPPQHLLTLRNRNVRRIGVVVHTTDRLDLIDRSTVSGLPVTSPTRTLIDLAAMRRPPH